MTPRTTPPSPHHVVADPDVERFAALDDLVWFEDSTPDETLAGMRAIPHRFAVPDDDGPYRGVLGVYDMELTVPGPPRSAPGSLPVAGLTAVGVHPDHRRTGVLGAMMREHLRWCSERRLPLSVLHASEISIYGRYGYAVASTAGEITLEHGAPLAAPGIDASDVRTTMTTLREDATVTRVHELQVRLAGRRVGAVTRTIEHSRRAFVDRAAKTVDRETRRVVIATRAGEDVGYAVLRRRSGWEGGRPAGTLECGEWAWADEGVQLALARRLTSVDLVTTSTISGVTADDALLWWCGGPRTVGHTPGDELWVRVIDLPGALAARGWAADGDLVVEVRDEQLPDNAGRWRLTIEAGRARVARTDMPADLALDIAVLGATYLGGRRLAALHRQGRVEVHRPEAFTRLDVALATATLPVAPIMF